MKKGIAFVFVLAFIFIPGFVEANTAFFNNWILLSKINCIKDSETIFNIGIKTIDKDIKLACAKRIEKLQDANLSGLYISPAENFEGDNGHYLPVYYLFNEIDDLGCIDVDPRNVINLKIDSLGGLNAEYMSRKCMIYKKILFALLTTKFDSPDLPVLKINYYDNREYICRNIGLAIVMDYNHENKITAESWYKLFITVAGIERVYRLTKDHESLKYFGRNYVFLSDDTRDFMCEMIPNSINVFFGKFFW